MKKIALLMVVAALILASCRQKEKNENPLLDEFDTPFGVPPFELIKASHFKPAYLKSFEEQKKNVQKIISNKQAPTFENTIKELEYSGELLTKVSRIFGSLNSANTNDSLQSINLEIAPLASKHRDDINLNDTLFQRVKSVYENREKLKLTEEEKKVLEDTYKDFVRNGAELSPEEKGKLRKINEELSLLSVKFGQNLLAETNAFRLVIDKKEDLAGLPEGLITQAASTAEKMNLKGKWAFTIQYPIMEPFLKYSEKRDLREKLFTAYFMKGGNGNQYDNNEIVSRITKLRVERSRLLGYKTYADFVLEKNMAKTPERVMGFLQQVWDAALPVAKAEAAAQQELIDKEGGKFKLEPWDWWYYTEKIKIEKYALDDEITRPYFKTENVIDGMFYVAKLTPDEASTLFHEFGHALHQLLSNSTYPSVSGTSVSRDFVELPSQIMEHWVLEPEVLKVYAKHYQTDEIIPAEIIEKLDKASKFNTGFATVEFLAAALLDMEYHTLSEPVDLNIRDFEKKAMDKYGLIPEIKPRYRSTYFNHIWSSGYASGYYSYYWSEMLDADAFQAFKETGDIFNPEVARKFEKEILLTCISLSGERNQALMPCLKTED